MKAKEKENLITCDLAERITYHDTRQLIHNSNKRTMNIDKKQREKVRLELGENKSG